MRTLIVQFQPKPASSVNTEAVISLCSRVAMNIPSLKGFAYQKGNDRGAYVNFQFEVPAAKLESTWQSIMRGVLTHHRWGPYLRRTCIVTCEGTRGWKNYLLLFHFNSNLKVDMLRSV